MHGVVPQTCTWKRPTGAALIAVGAALVAVAVRWSRNKK